MEYAPGRHAEVLKHSFLDPAPTEAFAGAVAQPKGQRVQRVLPDAFAYQLRGQTVQGVTVVGEDEPRGQRGLHKDEAVAIDSVDVPKGQGVQAREEDDAL